MILDNRAQWCIDQHRKTNHFYDEYLPYEFHLRMVVNICDQFIHIPERCFDDLVVSCWGHDLIEDCRVSYNDCKIQLGDYAANIIYAVTNEKGKNRMERANEKYYNGILTTEGAVFIKLCDRIANVQYSKMTNSKMFFIYQKENNLFKDKLFKDERYTPMFEYLESLFTT
jgi:(p)ppGpp synthase/HD superfamily hydrolase